LAKRKTKKTKKSSTFLKYLAISLGVVAVVLGGFIGGYYIGYDDAKLDIVKKDKHIKEKKLSSVKKLQKDTKKVKNSVNERLKKVLDKEAKKEHKITQIEKKIIKPLKKVKNITASHEIDSSQPPPRMKKNIKIVGNHKPKLAIIIDDVSVKSQVQAIKSLNIPLTMSFLPPSKDRPNSAKLAAKEKFYMVHLPLEAQNFNAEEPHTLRVSDSQWVIDSRIAEIKKLFPKVKFINNHTGSKFTESEIAMNRLIYSLSHNSISFIDSRTTGKTKVPKVLKNFGLKYVARDVFLDHHMDKAYVKSQIKQAIKIAKRDGEAIAIGHPHANTIMALYESKELLRDVDLVLIDKMY
jgi:polysaccharide deacetylase 2 family uncharacterized protein YibQ